MDFTVSKELRGSYVLEYVEDERLPDGGQYIKVWKPRSVESYTVAYGDFTIISTTNSKHAVRDMINFVQSAAQALEDLTAIC